MADLEHQASRIVDQRPDIVHDRLLELGERLRTEAPPIQPGTEAATFLGITGPLGIEIADRGPSRIDIRTTRGRVRGDGSAAIAAAPDGGTSLVMRVALRPQGFAANLMLSMAVGARPQMRQGVIDGLERGLDDLAVELAKPDDQWDPAAWMPSSLPIRG